MTAHPLLNWLLPTMSAHDKNNGAAAGLNGDEYVETIEYANESTKELIKQTFKFTIKVEGDTLTQTGVGNSFNEVWKRVK
jgi:hypothetical protein